VRSAGGLAGRTRAPTWNCHAARLTFLRLTCRRFLLRRRHRRRFLRLLGRHRGRSPSHKSPASRHRGRSPSHKSGTASCRLSSTALTSSGLLTGPNRMFRAARRYMSCSERLAATCHVQSFRTADGPQPYVQSGSPLHVMFRAARRYMSCSERLAATCSERLAATCHVQSGSPLHVMFRACSARQSLLNVVL